MKIFIGFINNSTPFTFKIAKLIKYIAIKKNNKKKVILTTNKISDLLIEIFLNKNLLIIKVIKKRK
ncbi:hypothetical protein [Candidatus Hepatoplasma crinochetorum]|jgi:hypothetical protein|uniref:hypothetical protein n=1 Tax=Candidatus Hepatoplasma crinochetorum TaxID=295596 RepID=UPI0004BBA290|nr:hypothetical protein [Candidatus Hepatoplasma crinochetorum]BDV02824.1 MAG: hypothetical protein HCTKY_1180 [Candidatus Hepatoplasma crinochetorum]